MVGKYSVTRERVISCLFNLCQSNPKCENHRLWFQRDYMLYFLDVYSIHFSFDLYYTNEK